MRLFITSILIASLLVTSLFVLRVQAQGENLQIAQEKVVYPLPYPGILTDHPLYFLKEWRDGILIFTTRDNIKKAQLFLHLSDKRMAIAQELAKKGKEQLSKSELQKAEQEFASIFPLLNSAKEQGSSPSGDLIVKMKQSNAKHKDVITGVMKDLNQAEISTFQEILSINDRASKQVNKY